MAKNGTIRTMDESHKLPCKLTDKERALAGESVAELVKQTEELEMEKKAYTASVGGQIKILMEKISRQSAMIRDGVEMRMVECELSLNYTTLKATVTRKDTKVEVETRDLNEDEKQMEFDV